MLLALLAACNDYELSKATDVGPPGDERPPRSDRDPPPDVIEPDVDTGGTPSDSGAAPPPEEEAPPPEEEPEPEPEPEGHDWSGCSDGYYADYFNLPADHPEVEGDISGLTLGDVPTNHDWYDRRYFVRREFHPGLEFGENWWPVDEGLIGDPQYYAVHFHAFLDVAADTVGVFELGSDDDGWAYIDGSLVADLGGIHGVTATTFTVSLPAGIYELDLYMAERHTSQAGFWFRWLSEGIDVWACP